MATYLEIQLPQPCSDNWQDMHQTNDGRYCGSCQKTVIDFSSMNDEQLLNYFKKNKTAVCGRYRNGQVNNTMPLPIKKIPWVTYFFRVAIPAFLFSNKATSQDTAVKAPTVMTIPGSRVRFTNKPLLPVNITGRITDERGNPVPFASVVIVGAYRGVSADVEGNYAIALHQPGQRIEVSSIGFQKTSILLNFNDQVHNIAMTNDTAQRFIMGEVIVVRKKRKKKKSIPVPAPVISSINSITLFPNPVKAFAPLTIRWKEPVSTNQEISIYNFLGALVSRQTIPLSKTAREITLNTQIKQPGYYVLHLTDSRSCKVLTESFVVE